MKCPKCANKEKVEFISKKYCKFGIKYQLICKNCGYLIKGHLDYNEL